MYGEVNPDIICRVIERIMSERNDGFEYRVKLVSRDKAKDEPNERNYEI